MAEYQDTTPAWMKHNPDIEHFDPFEGMGKLEEDEVRHLRYGINIGSYNLLFDKSILCEATINTSVYPIPNVPYWIKGMMNLRGNLIPVFYLDRLLSNTTEEAVEQKIVFVVGQGANAVGLSVNELPVAVEIDEDKVEPVAPPEDIAEILTDSVNTAYEIDNQTWLEIDIDTTIKNIKSLDSKDSDKTEQPQSS